MPGKCTIDAVFFLWRIQQEYLSKQKKLYMCFVDLEKAFDRVPRKVVEWAMRKKGIPEALATAVMSLYKDARTKVNVGTHLSEEFEVNVGVHQGSVLSPLLFAIVVDDVMKEIKEGMLHEILRTDGIVLIAETMSEPQEKIYGWKSAIESKGLKVNLMKIKVMVSRIWQVTVKPSSKKDPCDICGRKTMLNAVLCISCGNWLHGICAKIKRVTNRLAINFRCKKLKGYRKNVQGQKEKLHDDVETVTEFSCIGDRINSGGGCEVAVTSRTRIGWVRFRECLDLLCGKKFPLRTEGIVYKSCELCFMEARHGP